MVPIAAWKVLKSMPRKLEQNEEANEATDAGFVGLPKTSSKACSGSVIMRSGEEPVLRQAATSSHFKSTNVKKPLACAAGPQASDGQVSTGHRTNSGQPVWFSGVKRLSASGRSRRSEKDLKDRRRQTQ